MVITMITFLIPAKYLLNGLLFFFCRLVIQNHMIFKSNRAGLQISGRSKFRLDTSQTKLESSPSPSPARFILAQLDFTHFSSINLFFHKRLYGWHETIVIINKFLFQSLIIESSAGNYNLSWIVTLNLNQKQLAELSSAQNWASTPKPEPKLY